jgi:hypothetical protein
MLKTSSKDFCLQVKKFTFLGEPFEIDKQAAWEITKNFSCLLTVKASNTQGHQPIK